MPEIFVIDAKNKLPKGQDFNFLIQEGLEYVEGLAGKVWTDYNTHDPGITLLEAMCYALTDLGYRTAFDIKDIIASDKIPLADNWKKLFYTAREALPCNPLTLVDYRKLIVDTEGVKNAWIEISDEYEILMYLKKKQHEAAQQQGYELTDDFKKGEDVLRLRGLYKVIVEYEDNILEQKKEDEVATVIRQKLHYHRNLTEDFVDISSVEYEDFPVNAVIQVSEGADIDMINAKIYKVIHDFFSPPITFYSLEQMLEKNIAVEDIFEGPVLNYGFINTAELEESERFKNIHVSDIIHIISGIEGVIAIKKISFAADTASPLSNFSEWINNVKDKQKKPRLDVEKSNISFVRSGDRHRSDDKKKVNVARVNALFTFLKSDNFKTRLKGQAKDFAVPKGEYMNIADYYPFQKELPAAYGMMETFIADKRTIDTTAVEIALNELLAEKIGLNGARLTIKLLENSKHSGYIENIIDEIITSTQGDMRIAKNVVDKIWDDETTDKIFKTTIGEFIGNKNSRETEKSHLYNFIEHHPEYVTASAKSSVLFKLATQQLKKSLGKIKTNGDVANLDSVFKKYQINRLEKRKKTVLQLRGFLMVFEQILASYLSQLSHIRDIFSFDENIKQTFYPPLVEGINDMEALFIDFRHYADMQVKMMESPEEFAAKRNNILSHLLSRHSESMEKYAGFMQQFLGKEAPERLIKDKINFLSDYVQISGYRGKGYNYADKNENWNSNNVAGLKKRVCSLLGITNYETKRITQDALFVDKIMLENKVERYVVKLVDPKDKEQVLLKSVDYEYKSEAIIILTYILEQGYNTTLYKKEGHGDKWHFILHRPGVEGELEAVAYSAHYNNTVERNNALDKVISTLSKFSEEENFHIVEHILLRPKIGPDKIGNGKNEVALLAVEQVPDKISYTEDHSLNMPYKFRIVQIKSQSNEDKTNWRLSLMKNDTEILKINEDFYFYRQLTKRMKHIAEYGANNENYVTAETVDGNFAFKIIANGIVLAESKQKFGKAEDVAVEISDLVNFLSYQFLLRNGKEDDNNLVLYADPYSLQVSIIIPSWQHRFRNSTFKHLLEKTIYLEIASHVYPHIYWVNHDEMRQFEDAYELWVKETAFNEIPDTDIVNDFIAAMNKLKM